MENEYLKTVIIMRAVSGSGKTSIARFITDTLEQTRLSFGIHSTDEFFLVDNRYVFELEKLAEYHRLNLEHFADDLRRGTDVVVCDNMNLLPWQSESYTTAARENGYQIVFINFLTRELKDHIAAQQVTPEKPDAHNLSKELLVRLIDDFHTYNELLDENSELNHEKHFNFVWDSEKKERKWLDALEKGFDFDHVITIDPNQYHQIKHTIGNTVVKLIRREDG